MQARAYLLEYLAGYRLARGVERKVIEKFYLVAYRHTAELDDVLSAHRDRKYLGTETVAVTAMTGDILDKLLVILVLRLIEARLNYADNAGKLDIIAVNNAVKHPLDVVQLVARTVCERMQRLGRIFGERHIKVKAVPFAHGNEQRTVPARLVHIALKAVALNGAAAQRK